MGNCIVIRKAVETWPFLFAYTGLHNAEITKPLIGKEVLNMEVIIINIVVGVSLFMWGMKVQRDKDFFKIHDDREDRRRS